jgi:glutamate carboxypeptidase
MVAVMSDLPEAIVRQCRARTEQLLSSIEEIVTINSFSRHPEGGARVADVLMRELGDIPGIEASLHESSRFAPHVVATTDAASASASGCVALVGHHDTVFPPGFFEGFRVDGRLARGPGVLDMKSGLVIAISALRLLAEHDELSGVPARFVIVSDEEIGSPEGASLLETELDGADAALVFEAGRAHDAIITARKGTGGVRVTADGEDAIATLAAYVDRAQALTDYERGVTVNAGTVEGDAVKASALFDIRYITLADGEALIGDLERLADELPGNLTLSGGMARPPLERTTANVALFREYAGCAAPAGLGSSEASLIGGGSDASTTAALGVPSIDGLGPRGTGFHTRDELIEIETLPQRLEALVRFLWGRRR